MLMIGLYIEYWKSSSISDYVVTNLELTNLVNGK